MNYEDKLRDLLSKLSHKRQVRFALDCALDVKHLLKDISLKALETVALWLEDKATVQEIIEASAASAATSSVYYTAYAAAYTPAATAAYHANVAAEAAANAAHAVAYAAAFNAAKALNLPLEHSYTKLLNSLTEFEKTIYGL